MLCSMNFIGVDIGGTKIEAAQISNHKILQLLSVKTNSAGSESEVVSQVTKLIDQVVDKNTKSIGVAVPAIVDLEQGIVLETVNIPSWKKVPLKKILEQKYKIPVFINNDANCFALGEKHFGAGRNFKNMVVITIGTGLGAGIIINDKLYVGHNCGAGEFGEVVFKDHNFEYYCSGKFFQQEYKLNGEELLKRAKQGDKKALTIFSAFGEHVGKMLALVVHTYDPELIILGGSVSKSFPYFERSMKESLKNLVYARSYAGLKIKFSNTKNIVVLGAASLS